MNFITETLTKRTTKSGVGTTRGHQIGWRNQSGFGFITMDHWCVRTARYPLRRRDIQIEFQVQCQIPFWFSYCDFCGRQYSFAPSRVQQRSYLLVDLNQRLESCIVSWGRMLIDSFYVGLGQRKGTKRDVIITIPYIFCALKGLIYFYGWPFFCCKSCFPRIWNTNKATNFLFDAFSSLAVTTNTI